jgi:hypothetical protein
MIEKMPELALHALIGFGIYKLIVYLSTTGAIYKIGTLAITKLHDAYKSPRPPQETVVKYDLGRHFISSDQSLRKFQDLLDLMRVDRKDVSQPKHGNLFEVLRPYEYIFSRDVEYLVDAYHEKRARDKEGKKA